MMTLCSQPSAIIPSHNVSLEKHSLTSSAICTFCAALWRLRMCVYVTSKRAPFSSRDPDDLQTLIMVKAKQHIKYLGQRLFRWARYRYRPHKPTHNTPSAHSSLI